MVEPLSSLPAPPAAWPSLPAVQAAVLPRPCRPLTLNRDHSLVARRSPLPLHVLLPNLLLLLSPFHQLHPMYWAHTHHSHPCCQGCSVEYCGR